MSLELGTSLPLLAHGGHALDHELEAVSAPFGARDCLFNLEEGIGIIKLLAQINHLFSGLVHIIAGTGKQTQQHLSGSDNLMSHDENTAVLTIDSHEGWTFAFEGGAHILFRQTGLDHRFVHFP